jgi:hypothetical protein
MKVLREHLLVIFIFLVLALIFTASFVTNMNDAVISSRVDNLLNVWIMSWDGHAIVSNPAALFQANINYPSPDSLAFSEHILSFALVAEPIAWITGNPIFAYNFIAFIGFALCGYTMYLLVKYLTKNRLAALAAGAFFAFVPYHFSTIVHVHVTLYCLQPLIILLLFKYFEEGRTRDLVGLGIAFLAQSLLSWYQLAFSSIPIALFLIWQLFSRQRREKARYFLYVIGVLILCMIIVIPLAIPYFRLRNDYIPEEESEPAIKVISHASVGDYFRVLPQNWFYDKLGFFNTGSVGEGNSLFPGFLVFPLALIALFFLLKKWRDDRSSRAGLGSGQNMESVDEPPTQEEKRPGEETTPDERAPPHKAVNKSGDDLAPPRSYFIYFVVLGIVAFVLSIGPNPRGISNIFYKALHKLPFYGFVRFPTRYHILVILSLAVIIGYACTYIYQYVKGRKDKTWASAAIVIIIILILFEFLIVSLPYAGVEVGADVPLIYKDLDQVEEAVIVEAPMPFVDNSVVFEDPLTINYGTLENTFNAALWEQDAVYFSIYNWHELINGMSGYFPIFYRRALVEMQSFPSPRALEFLQGSGVDHIILNWNKVAVEEREALRQALETLPGVALIEDYPDDFSLYALLDTGTASVDELEYPLYLPESADPDQDLNASIGFINETEDPFANQVEEKQHLEVEWQDTSGEVIKMEETYYYAPFFIQAGEGAVAPFKAAAPAQTGDYHLTITATDGILEGRSWEEDIAVAESPSIESGQPCDGSLTWVSEEEGLQLWPGEVFSPFVEADNLGQVQWLREKADIVGSVGITAVWTKEGDQDYEMQQQGMLPCDISPGQEELFPIALQAPRDTGQYNLSLHLNCLGVQYIGEPIIIPVTIGVNLDGISP